MNLLEEFSKRCLFKSLTFIENLKIPYPDFTVSQKEQRLITNFYQRDYMGNADLLKISAVCDIKKELNDRVKVFLCLYSRVIYEKMTTEKFSNSLKKIINECPSDDCYFLFLKALVAEVNQIDLFLESLKLNNYLYDAFEELLYITDLSNYNYVSEKLNIYITDNVLKQIYTLHFYVCRLLKPTGLAETVKYLIKHYKLEYILAKSEAENRKIDQSKKISYKKNSDANLFICNLLGSVFYTRKDFKLSVVFFEENLRHKNFCFEFIEMYSHILYLNNEMDKLATFAQKLVLKNRNRAETMISIANFYSLGQLHVGAIDYLEKCIKLEDKWASNYTLLGNEYVDMNMYPNAIECYLKSLKFNIGDYRAYHGLGNIKKNLDLDLEATYFLKKAAEIQSEDPYFWIEYGKALEKVQKYDDAFRAYERAHAEGDIEGMLKAGDLAKKCNKFTQAMHFYEKYVEECKTISKSCESVVDCIIDFYNQIGNSEKVNHFLKFKNMKSDTM
ncbi:hypothetical protein EDEG_03662 [Edhazardia aedis USNM 41457]|uniref:Uncharacterized protein n=1 Tax=Edhazardia aedis (strain USNM 41457) TaxID=1003232 RepID=J8ZQ92_EDHAE|nr:hypothetical protein EDEG_03662 [Edhazardia aedis USNM 41457]|eukprot:EJW01863.1 hypothetical protein EDEG_03662 [Edhazardia aedis USNM 41457]